jgi:predicted aspartyl protease
MMTVTIAAAALLATVLIGSLVLMRLATTREHRDGHLPTQATTWLAVAARSITGLYVEVAEPGIQSRYDRTLIGAVSSSTSSGAGAADTRRRRDGR